MKGISGSYLRPARDKNASETEDSLDVDLREDWERGKHERRVDISAPMMVTSEDSSAILGSATQDKNVGEKAGWLDEALAHAVATSMRDGLDQRLAVVKRDVLEMLEAARARAREGYEEHGGCCFLRAGRGQEGLATDRDSGEQDGGGGGFSFAVDRKSHGLGGPITSRTGKTSQIVVRCCFHE